MAKWISVVLLLLLCSVPVGGQGPRPEQPSDEQILFGDLPKVEAASLHAQTLAEAPANVSVITAEEIRRYGYRTLGEALNSVRGFYMGYDHSYYYMGVHGFSLPGDFNTRFLVMLNGHPLTDNIYNSNNYFGQDFGLDMDLVERIEIIRGPTSALYGSNGMLANINVVTRSPVDSEHLRAAFETSSFGERKLSLASSLYLGRGANLLISGSVFNNSGISFPLNGLLLPPGVQSPVANADGERGYHTFANLIWHDWSFTAYFNSRRKEFPIGIGTSFSGDPAQRVVDGRSAIEAIYRHTVGPGQLQWRFAYDQYRYRDRFDYPGETQAEVIDFRDINNGDWLDSQVTYDLPLGRIGPFTVGLQGFWELRNEQYNLEDGTLVGQPINRPDRGIALFAQQEFDLSPRWKVYAGVRFDQTRYFHSFVSPRVAVVYQHSPRTVYKFVYGRPFRNPSTFEQFYNDGGLSYAAAPPLEHETAHAFEASMERRVGRDWTIVLNGFHYRLQRVIEAVTLADGVQQYQNGGTDLSTGIELELRAKLWDRLEVSGSTAFQRTAAVESGASLANAPRHVSKLRLGMPAGRLFLAAEWRYLSARNTWGGERLGGALAADATATVFLNRRCDLQVGLRNALDRRYEDPIYLAADRIRGDGRSVFVRLVWHVWE